jgi:hypothetical protein
MRGCADHRTVCRRAQPTPGYNPQNANRPELLFVQAHGVKGVAKAMLSKVTKVYAVRYEGVAYTLLTDNSVWARRAMQLNGGR